MHQALYHGAVFRLDRQHIPVVSHRNDRILQRLLQRGGVNHLVQLVPDPVLCASQMPPDIHQFAACPVGNFILGNNSIRNVLFYASGNKKPFRFRTQERGVLPLRHQRVLGGAACPQQLCHIQQHAGAQASAFLADHQCRLHIRERDHRMASRVLQDHRCFFCFRLQGLHGGQFVRRLQLPAFFRSGRRQGAFRQELADPGKFQHPQCSFLHHLYNSLSLCL